MNSFFALLLHNIISSSILVIILGQLRLRLIKFCGSVGYYYLWLIPVVRLVFPWSFKVLTIQLTPVEAVSGGLLSIPNLGLIIIFVWLIGAITYICVSCRFYIGFHTIRWQRRSSSVVNEFNETLDECKREVNVRSYIRIVSYDKEPCPITTGLLKPLIVLPERAWNKTTLRLTILHELCHQRYGDIWLKALVTLITSVYWWNPFVYTMTKNIGEASEMACDARVTANMSSDEKEDYLRVIYSFITNGGKRRAKTGIFASLSAKSSEPLVFMRMKLIRNGVKPKKYVTPAIAALMIACSFISMGVPKEEIIDRRINELSFVEQQIPLLDNSMTFVRDDFGSYTVYNNGEEIYSYVPEYLVSPFIKK